MAGHIFLPVPTTEIEASARRWQEGQARKNKQPYQILQNSVRQGAFKGITRTLGLRCLRGVAAGDKLYVMLHGLGYPSAGSFVPAFLGDTRDSGVLKKYTPAELASVLAEEGLTKSIGAVNLFACGSGLEAEAGSWAARLKHEMQGLGYGNVTVTGYLGDVRPSYAPRQTADRDYTDSEHKGIVIGDGSIYRASSHKATF